MDKIVRLGTNQTHGGRFYSIYARIQLADGRLSITGVEGPTPSGNALGGCGQINPVTVNKRAPQWTSTMLRTFNYVWGRWHLNDLQTACIHQRELGWTYQEYQGQHCPECDYAIGSAWVSEPLPKSVVHFLETLPETDKTPAWA